MVIISLFIFGFNGGFDDKELFVRLGIHLATPFFHFEVWGMKSGDIWRR